jgi:2-phospho-L-lactate guanylyltransferase
MWALLPVKRLKGAKKRLSPLLSEDERSGLARAMLEDVLAALEGANNLDGIAIVTDDEDAIKMGEAAGHTMLAEPEAGGLNGALSHGLQALMNKGVRSVFIIHGDVPAVTSDEIDQLVALQPPPSFVTIAKALSDGGTNGMAISPPDCIPMLYGKDSANRHISIADQLDIPVEYALLDGLGLDIDHPEDLGSFLAQAPEGATMDYLLATGLNKRLKEQIQTK